jgi:hypothetical protein
VLSGWRALAHDAILAPQVDGRYFFQNMTEIASRTKIGELRVFGEWRGERP